MVRRPALANRSAAEAPAGPPPSTATVFITLSAHLVALPETRLRVQEPGLLRRDVRGAVARPYPRATRPCLMAAWQYSRAGPKRSPPAIGRHAARACTSSPFHDSHCYHPLDEKLRSQTPYSFQRK